MLDAMTLKRTWFLAIRTAAVQFPGHHHGRLAMHAVGYKTSLPIENDASLVDIELPRPEALGRDILVAVRAVSVNPVDTKVRMRAQAEAGSWKVLGWDAAGTVEAVGPAVTLFRPGDEVFYAGALDRPGTNAAYHLVDERIVGRKPASLSWAEAAAIPLTAITAWETLFDRLDVRKRVPGAANAILIVGGAGGVGSITIQLARRLTDLTVIATASRPETRQWALELGAHHVVEWSAQGVLAFYVVINAHCQDPSVAGPTVGPLWGQ